MTTRTHERRSTMMVNRPMQGRLIKSIALFPTIALAVMTMVVVFFGRQLVHEALALGADLPSMVPLLVTILCFVVVVGAFIATNAIKLSNRIAGPSHRVVEALRRVRAGDVGFRVQTRDGDHLKEISEELNLLLESLDVEQTSTEPDAAATLVDAAASMVAEQPVAAQAH